MYRIIQLVILSLIFSSISISSSVTGYRKECLIFQCKDPVINDPNLGVSILYQGNSTTERKNLNQLSPVTNMAFLGPNDILLLDKNGGKVLRILNNTLLDKPLLEVNVTNKWERGLLGIAISKESVNVYVFLYYTESRNRHGADICPLIFCMKSMADPSNNYLYRYELRNNSLVNPSRLLSLPPSNVASHIGGNLEIGPDGNLYIIIGDFHGNYNKTTSTLALNFRNGGFPDGRAGILRLTQDGKPVGHGILGEKYPLDLYYAYGIRNGYGLDFDPISGKLWDSENGPDFGDELNLVEPGFNSGWAKIQGIWQDRNHTSMGKIVLDQPQGLVTFGGRGKYRSPEVVWNSTIAPTAIKFLNSGKLGNQYENDLFVASFNKGEIYHFDLNDNRTGLKLPSVFNGSLFPENGETNDLIFARGLGKITDMDVGPDGNLYVLSRYFGKPTIFKISYMNETEPNQ